MICVDYELIFRSGSLVALLKRIKIVKIGKAKVVPVLMQLITTP
jgi:hypothetical protein